jgi:hypothetical protein
VQHDRDGGRLQRCRAIDRKLDRPWRLRLDPVAEPAERTIPGKRCADDAAQSVEGGITGGGLHDCLDFGAVLVVVAQRR